MTDAQGNVYYLNEANTTTSVNGTETTSPAEEGTVVEGVTKVTYIYEKLDQSSSTTKQKMELHLQEQ